MAFMPPEQFQDAKRVDARCDVYSLAATLYFALTGVVPFQGRGERTSMAKKLRNEIERPSTLFPALRPGLSDTICKALDANPNCRPASCRAFAHALRGALGGARTGRLGRGTADGAERRAAARHPVALRASCRSRPESPRQFPAEVRDISQTGIQLALGRRFEPGATLLVQVLSHPPRGPMRIQVCWARDVSPQQWALGCEFERSLTEDELHALIGQGTSPVVVREGR
jgi:serine/threonine protein kinase